MMVLFFSADIELSVCNETVVLYFYASFIVTHSKSKVPLINSDNLLKIKVSLLIVLLNVSI